MLVYDNYKNPAQWTPTNPPNPGIIDNIVAFVKEFFSTLIFMLLYCFPASFFNKYWAVPNDKTPLLMIHGFLHNSSCWYYSIQQLKNDSGAITTINLGHPFHTLEEYVLFAAEKIAEIAEDQSTKEVNLCGHSMGGIVSCFLAEELDNIEILEDSFTDSALKERVRIVAAKVKDITIKKVITIGSPLHGTSKGKFLSFLNIPCVQQMKYQSDFTTTLVDKIESSTKDTQYLHIGAAEDLIVQPVSSCFIDQPRHANKVISRQGHLSLLFSSEMYKYIIDFLNPKEAD